MFVYKCDVSADLLWYILKRIYLYDFAAGTAVGCCTAMPVCASVVVGSTFTYQALGAVALTSVRKSRLPLTLREAK